MGQRLVLSVKSLAKGDTLANVYMHWAAYTGSAIEVTDKFIKTYQNWARLNPQEKKIFGKEGDLAVARQKEIIAMLMMDCWPGALPGEFYKEKDFYTYTSDDPQEYEEQSEDYGSAAKLYLVVNGMIELASRLPDKFEYDRNEGLIGVTKAAIGSYQEESEGDVEIFIDEDGSIAEIYFGIVWSNEWDDACEEYEDDDELGTKEQQLINDVYETEFVDNNHSNFLPEEWDEFKDICDRAWDAGKYKIGSKKNNSVWTFIE